MKYLCFLPWHMTSHAVFDRVSRSHVQEMQLDGPILELGSSA